MTGRPPTKQCELRELRVASHSDAELLRAPIECLAAHAELRGLRAGDDAGVGGERGADGGRVGLVHEPRDARARRRREDRDPRAVIVPIRRQQHRALDDVAQLAHVAGPRMRDERRARVLRQQLRRPAGNARASGRMSSRRADSCARNERDHVQSVVEVLAERPWRMAAGRVAVQSR